MGTISTSGIQPQQVIKSEHLLRIIAALSGQANNDIILSGSLKTLSNNIVDFVSAQYVTGSFKGDGSQLTGIPTGSGGGSQNLQQTLENGSVGQLVGDSAIVAITTMNSASTSNSQFALAPGLFDIQANNVSQSSTVGLTPNNLTLTKGTAVRLNISDTDTRFRIIPAEYENEEDLRTLMNDPKFIPSIGKVEEMISSSSGGGGSQNLQQVLTNGSSASLDNGSIIDIKVQGPIEDLYSYLKIDFVSTESIAELGKHLPDGSRTRIAIGASTDGLGGVQVMDQASELGLIYHGNYNANQLQNDRAVTDVGGVIQLISSNSAKFGTVTDESFNGEDRYINFEQGGMSWDNVGYFDIFGGTSIDEINTPDLIFEISGSEFDPSQDGRSLLYTNEHTLPYGSQIEAVFSNEEGTDFQSFVFLPSQFDTDEYVYYVDTTELGNYIVFEGYIQQEVAVPANINFNIGSIDIGETYKPLYISDGGNIRRGENITSSTSIPTLQEVLTTGSSANITDKQFVVSIQNSSNTSQSYLYISNEGTQSYALMGATTDGYKKKTIEFNVDGTGSIVIDTISNTGLLYAGDYTVNQLPIDNAIPSVKTVKQLITNSPALLTEDNFDFTSGSQIFELSFEPKSNTIVFVNGIRLRFPTQYTVSGSMIEITDTLTTGDWIAIDYNK